MPQDRPPGHFAQPAYGGAGWSQRAATHREEIGRLWSAAGIDGEWRSLRRVALRRPGPELEMQEGAAEEMLFSRRLDLGRAQAEHDALAEIYRAEGVEVIEIAPSPEAMPNQMFCADLMAMTPEGAIVARPASTVRAGEEVELAAGLAAARVPILMTLTGQATFEGADLLWLDPETAAIGRGLRTNEAAIRQITAVLGEAGYRVLPFDMPFGTMHLMGMLRILDADLAVAWPRRTPHALVMALRERGCEVAFLPDEAIREAETQRGFNAVTLGPRRAVMPGPNPATRAFFEGLGVEVIETGMAELGLANGAVGCLTGIVQREMAA